MRNAQTKKFIGGGLNGSSFLTAVRNSFHDPSGIVPPIGVTWPLARLSISEKSVELRMPYIRKSVPASGTKVSLSKFGYLCFQTSERENDLGFSTFRMGALIRELKQRGYQLDETCNQNLFAAQVTTYSMTTLGTVGLVCGVLAIILGS